MDVELDSGFGAASRSATPQKKNRRRMTVSDRFGDLVGTLRGTFDKLNACWDEVDMDEEMRMSRSNTAFQHTYQLFADMVESERDMVQGVQRGIEDGLKEVAESRKLLEMGDFKGHGKPRSLKLLEEIRAETRRLRTLVDERIREQAELVENFTRLANRLGEDFSDAAVGEGEVLSPGRLGVLVARAHEMESLINERMGLVREYQESAQKSLRQLGRNVNDSCELIRVLLDSDPSADDFQLDQGHLDAFAEAVTALESERFELVQQLEFEYNEKMIRLADLWSKCCTPVNSRRFAEKFDPELHNSSTIQEMEVAIYTTEKLYNDRKMVYDKMKEWEALWEEKIGFEQAENDPSRFTNRGGELDRRLKRARAVEQKLLPHAEQELAAAFADYKVNCPNDEILFDGFNPVDYIKNLMKRHREEKELEKQLEKARRREQQLANTPMRTVASVGRLHHTPDVSRIGVPLPQTPGPKTSSPKAKRGATLAGLTPCPSPLKRMPISSPALKSRNWKP